MTQDPRTFYETAYHFDEDIERPDFNRLRHALNVAGLQGIRRFLDLGCGTGWLSLEVLRHYTPEMVVGLDFSRRALLLARDHLPKDLVWVQGDGVRLPFRDQTFDHVFSFGSLEHFPDIPGALREIHRILTEDGKLVVVVPNFYVRTEQPQEFRASLRGWKAILHSGGFQVVRVGVDRGPRLFKNRKPHRIALRALIRILNRIPGMAYQYILVCTKHHA